MADIRIRPTEIIGTIKPVHGVGQPPFQGLKFPLFHYLTEARIPYSRLHDMGSYLGGHLVDIHCVFPNFDADPADPASYDFAFTDQIITALVEAGVEPVYRLGETIENYAHIKSYHVHPPKDFLHWARICEGIIRHYTEGWADGFHYVMKYWEIWNEPESGDISDASGTWAGTAPEFFDFYRVAATHLKSCFPHLMIGGYSSCGFRALTCDDADNPELHRIRLHTLQYFDYFLAFCQDYEVPLDFFSWHTYDTDIENNRRFTRYARERLDAYGFIKTETTCNEWNCGHNERATLHHAAFCAGMFVMFQEEPIESAMFYDARLGPSIYGGLFNPLTHKPLPAYYSFLAWGELYGRKNQVRLENTDPRLYAAAAADDETVAAVFANPGSEAIPLRLDGFGDICECRILTEGRIWEVCTLPASADANTVLFLTAKK